MAKKSIYSIKDELIRKSREAMMAAVQTYNNPSLSFKAETFITLAIISWTYLLHAFYRKEKIEYRYYEKVGKVNRYNRTKYGAYKHWELERCVNDVKCPLDFDTKANLKFLIGIRHEIEHQMTNRIDEYLSAKLQACAINFDYYITLLFGEKYSLSDELALSIQFSPLNPHQRESLIDNNHITTNVMNFISEYENNLSQDSLQNSRYAYRVLFIPVNAKRKGQADKVIEFVDSKSELAAGLEKSYTILKETEKRKYKPGEIVSEMKKSGYINFSIRKHTDLWKSKDARNPKYSYGVNISGYWYWYQPWFDLVKEYCEKNRKELSEGVR